MSEEEDLILRLEAEALDLYDCGFPEAGKLMLDARDEIERLRAVIAEQSAKGADHA
jgi:hypothetical protein